MAENGNGYNGRFTAQQFIDAIPGTGGIVSALADKCGCAWNSARDAIDRWPTVKRAWENERHRVTDQAQRNVIKAIVDDKDLPTSKWWLQLMDDEFIPKQKQSMDVTSGGERIGGVSDKQHDRAISALAAAIGSILPAGDSGEPGAVGATEHAAVVGASEPSG